MSKIFLVYVIIISLHVKAGASGVFFVDAVKGNNNNTGKSINEAWKTVEKVNSFRFQPGDKILFRRGQEFTGPLNPTGNGKKDQPVTVASYGVGRRPVINAGNSRYAVRLMNAENWIISDLETTGGSDAGIFAGCSEDGRELVNIRIYNCFVHNIGDTAKVPWDYSTVTGGIVVVNGTLDGNGIPVYYNSTCNNVIIEDCSVLYNYRWTCISITSGKINGRAGKGNRIRNCTVAFSSADGIRMNGVSDSFIEYCVLYRNGAWPNPDGQNLGGLGAWFFDGINCNIQYCEAGWVRTITSDGGAFDIDYRQKNSTVQYCYGHHCASYGVSVFGAEASFPTMNSTIRYNIFSSNAMDKKFGVQGEYFVFTWSGGLLNGVNIHDNLSYWDPVVPAPAHNFNADFTGDNLNTFSRNTLVSRHPWLAYHKTDSMKSDSNIFIVTGTPAFWKMKKDSFHELKSWQQATGMDVNSTFRTSSDSGENRWKRIEIPRWYHLEVAGIPLELNVDAGIRVGDHIPVGSALELKGKAVLITFTGMHSRQESQAYEATRIQYNYLQSMLRQYGLSDVTMIVIDESPAIGSTFGKDDWLNYTSDLSTENSEKIKWIRDDKKGTLAKQFGISAIPDTYLVSGNGTIIARWQGVVLPAEIAFDIEEALGM